MLIRMGMPTPANQSPVILSCAIVQSPRVVRTNVTADRCAIARLNVTAIRHAVAAATTLQNACRTFGFVTHQVTKIPRQMAVAMSLGFTLLRNSFTGYAVSLSSKLDTDYFTNTSKHSHGGTHLHHSDRH